jgi:hypothetical protein
LLIDPRFLHLHHHNPHPNHLIILFFSILELLWLFD